MKIIPRVIYTIIFNVAI